MRRYDIIIKKRNGQPLTTQEINFIISGYINEDKPLVYAYFNNKTKFDKTKQIMISS